MKLTFLGNAYEMPDPISSGSNSIDQPRIKLIYRDCTYYTTRPRVVASEAIKSDGATVTLIYRSVTYERKLQIPQPYQKPRAINWRYRMLMED
jgi:hypothetical protein